MELLSRGGTFVYVWDLGSQNQGISTMPRTKPSTHRGQGGMIVCRQIATGDASLPKVVAQTVVTSGDLDWNEACMGACTAAA